MCSTAAVVPLYLTITRQHWDVNKTAQVRQNLLHEAA
jgi:hypothetical protein